MKLISALVGLTALGGIALATAPASAMPIAVPGQVSQASNVEQVNYVCNEWGHCWPRHHSGEGYYHPHYWGGYGGGYGWHRHYWHPHYWGGGWGGWGGGYGWHHWQQWHHW